MVGASDLAKFLVFDKHYWNRGKPKEESRLLSARSSSDPAIFQVSVSSPRPLLIPTSNGEENAGLHCFQLANGNREKRMT